MTVRSCPQCGASVQEGDDFCGNCGTYLGWSAAPAGTVVATGAAGAEPTARGEPVPPADPLPSARSAVGSGSVPAREPDPARNPERGADRAAGDDEARSGRAGGDRAGGDRAGDGRARRDRAEDEQAGDDQAGEGRAGAGSAGEDLTGEGLAGEGLAAVQGLAAGGGLPSVRDLITGGASSIGDRLLGGLESVAERGSAEERTGARAGTAAGVGPAVGESAATRPGLWARWRAWVRSRFGGGSGEDTAVEPTGTGAGATGGAAARARTGAGSEAVVAPGPSEVVLGPVLPGRPEAKRPLPTSGGGVAVDGPPCPVCGTTNPPGRRFCRRCATPLLADGPVTGPARRRRSRRRGDTSRWLRRLTALLVVAALVVAGILFYPKAVELFEDLRDRLATPAPIGPARTAATAEVPGHPAAAAADGLSNRYWGAPAVGDAVEFTFDQPFRLLSVVVHTGASAQREQFAEQARPTALDVVVTSAGGTTRTVAVTLADQPGPQRTDTGISDVVAVRLVVKAAAGEAPGRHIALGEVEFFRRP